MDPTRFDRISTRFAARRMSRRQALATGGTGLAAGALAATGLGTAIAQDATPEATLEAAAVEKTTYLFVQSFQSGSIAPAEGVDGRYTVTLDQGLGSTIYFGDRPSRDVGTTPTPQFLEGLGFLEDNPPNAALLVETEGGETDITVVELYNPSYDPATRGVTYDVAVLESWQDDLELGLPEAPVDLASLAPQFGTAHLLIDDCPTALTVWCSADPSTNAGTFSADSCWNYSVCMPCEPYGNNQPSRCATVEYWTAKCNQTFAGCGDHCTAVFDWLFANAGC